MGQKLKVLKGGKRQITVAHPDGAPMRIPREWTDADAVSPVLLSEGGTVCTVRGLAELARVVDGLLGRLSRSIR